MMERDHRGKISRTRRQVKTRINAEILLGEDWKDVAYLELMRLSLEVNAYHMQLKGKIGFEETGKAVQALQEACDAFQEEFGEDPDEQSSLI